MYEAIQSLARTSSLAFEARIPGSKSYTNRALLLAAMRIGTTRITGALHCDDTVYLAEALNQFGGLKVRKTDYGFEVTRTPGRLAAPAKELFVGGAGTPARFLLSFATAVEGDTVITGNERLCQRPMSDLLDAFRKMGVRYECLKSEGRLPVRVHGGDIPGKEWEISGEVSSQFLSSLLLLAAQQPAGPVEIAVHGHLVSKTYVEMTLDYLRKAGIQCGHTDYQRFAVHPAPIQLEGGNLQVEVDASGMSYFLVAAAITKTTVRVPGIGRGSVQGDLGLAFALERMGCSLTFGDDELVLTGDELHGIEIDMENMPDTVLSLAIAASQAKGKTLIKNIANLRVKECDRIHAACAELSKLGVKVEEGADYFAVHPRPNLKPASIETYDDHRVAMSFGLLKLLYPGIEIENPKCVGKSFPEFWSELHRFIRHQEGKGQG